MENFVHEMLHDSPPARRIMALYDEYEAQETAEARFVKGARDLRLVASPRFAHVPGQT
jgi:5'-deoxynucleotidase YfbR-like HD superfamily hydrolase